MNGVYNIFARKTGRRVLKKARKAGNARNVEEHYTKISLLFAPFQHVPLFSLLGVDKRLFCATMILDIDSDP
jgi:hypothetical protein